MQNKPTKKIPERHCAGCNAARPKNDMIRVVRCPDGTVTIDFKGKMSGRGVYICHDPNCLKKAMKSKRLERNLNVEIPDAVFDKLTAVVEQNGEIQKV